MNPWLLLIVPGVACLVMAIAFPFGDKVKYVVGVICDIACIVTVVCFLVSPRLDSKPTSIASESRSDYAVAQSAYKDYKKVWNKAIKSPDPAIKRFAESHRPDATSVKLPSKPAHVDRKILRRELNAEKRATKANKENLKILKQLLASVATGQPKAQAGTTSA